MTDADTKLDNALREPEPAIGDDGFTDGAMARLPYRAPERTVPGRWTVAGAAIAGSFATLVLAPPIESAFGLLALPGSTQTLILTVAGFVTVVAVPLGWLFGSRIMATLRWAAAAISVR